MGGMEERRAPIKLEGMKKRMEKETRKKGMKGSMNEGPMEGEKIDMQEEGTKEKEE